MFFDNWFARVLNNKLEPFFCQSAFCIFGSCMLFSNKFVDEKHVFGSCEKFEMILNAGEFNHCDFTILSLNNSWMEMDENSFLFSAATAKTAKPKGKRHNTVHVA